MARRPVLRPRAAGGVLVLAVLLLAGLAGLVGAPAVGASVAVADRVLALVEEDVAFFSVARQAPLLVGPDAALVLPAIAAVGASWVEEPRGLLVGATHEWSLPVGADPASGRGVVDLTGVPAGEYRLYVDTYGGSVGVSWVTPLEVTGDGPDLVAAAFDGPESRRSQGFSQVGDARLRPGEVTRISGAPGRDLSDAVVLLVVADDADFAYYPQEELRVQSTRDAVTFTVPAALPRGDGLAELSARGLQDVERQVHLPAASHDVAHRAASEPTLPATAGGPGAPLHGANPVYLSVLLPEAEGAFGTTVIDHALEDVVIDAGPSRRSPPPAPAPTPAPPVASPPVTSPMVPTPAAPGPVATPAAAAAPSTPPVPAAGGAGAPVPGAMNPGLTVDAGRERVAEVPAPAPAQGRAAGLLLGAAAATAAAVAVRGGRRSRRGV